MEIKNRQWLEASLTWCETAQAGSVGALVLALFNLFSTTKLAALILAAIWFFTVWGLKTVHMRGWLLLICSIVLAVILTISWPYVKKELNSVSQEHEQIVPTQKKSDFLDEFEVDTRDRSIQAFKDLNVNAKKTSLHATNQSKNFFEGSRFEGEKGSVEMNRIGQTGNIKVEDTSIGFGANSTLSFHSEKENSK